MKVKRLKRWVVPVVYLSAVSLVMLSIFLGIEAVNSYFSSSDDFNYSINNIGEKPVLPVQANDVVSNNEKVVSKPYNSDKVSIIRYFYNIDDNEERQEDSIILYENTYIQNTGIDYVSDEEFDIICILDGKVITIEENDVLGNIIKIEHDNNLTSIYEGVKDIVISEGDVVKEGDKIGVSGTSKINSEYENTLHFEIYDNGKLIDPEKYFLNTNTN